jgi:single-stranded DNA-binding protein
MEYLNLVQLIGYTTEPKVTETEYGKAGRFGIYTKRYAGKDKEGNYQYADESHNCQVAGKLAESLKIGKGDLVYVAGEIRYNKKDGVAYANIHVTELKVLKKKKEQRGGEKEFPEEG